MRRFKVGLMTLMALVMGACSSFQSNDLEKKEFSIRKLWIKQTTAKTNLGFRKINRMSPLLTPDLILQGNGVDGLVAYDRQTGAERWRLNIENGVESGLARVNDRIFFGGNDGQFYSATLSTGKVLWSFPTRAETLSEPVIEDGVVYFLNGNNVLFALDAESGKQLWLYSRIDATALSIRGGAKPAIRSGVIYEGFSDGYLVALNSKTGTVRWEKQLNRNKKFKDVDSSPIIDGDVIYVSGFDNALYAVRAQTGEVIWSVNKGGFGAATLVGDILYYSTSEGEVLAMEKATGKTIWTYKVKAGVATQPVFYAGFISFGESSGDLVFLDSHTGQLVSSFSPGRGIMSPPSVDEKLRRLYFISNEANLFALETSWIYPKKDKLPWE